jgi:hypothetical protein
LAVQEEALVDLVYQLPKEVLRTQAVLVFPFQSQVHRPHMQQAEMAILTGQHRNSLQVLLEQVTEVALDLQVVQV